MRPPSRVLISARILLDQTQRDVAAGCELTKKTVHIAELGKAGVGAIEKLVRYYNGEGITFLMPEGDEGWGVKASRIKTDYDTEKKAKKAEDKSKSKS